MQIENGSLQHRMTRRTFLAICFIERQNSGIAHLCVGLHRRCRGVGKALVEKLKAQPKHLRGMRLWCRRDYQARAAWPNYGFAPILTKRGRGAGGAELEFWWPDHNHADL